MPPQKRQSKKTSPRDKKKKVASDTGTSSSDDERKLFRTPYIGPASEAPAFLIQNKYLVHGYRINHNSYKRAFWSLFSLHNESINIWSHFIGAAIFVWSIWYLLMYMQAPSMQEQSVLQRIMPQIGSSLSSISAVGNLDRDDLFCMEESFATRLSAEEQVKMCDLKSDEILEDLLEGSWLTDWHTKDMSIKPGKTMSVMHYNLDYHHSAFERIECFLWSAVSILSKPIDSFESCQTCMESVLRRLPSYLSERLNDFLVQMREYDASQMDVIAEAPKKISFTIVDETIASETNPIVKLWRINSFYFKDLLNPKNEYLSFMQAKIFRIRGLVSSINERVAMWFTSAPEERADKILYHDQAHQALPRWPLYVHAFAAVIQMFLSGWYHLNSCQSADTMFHWRAFDLVGIIIMICGSSQSPIYYNFYCEESLYFQKLYLTIVYVTCALAGFVVMRPGTLRDHRKQYVCAFAFIIAGWSSTPGIIHMIWWRDPRNMYDFSVWPWLTGGLMYTVGALFYALRFPERYFKGWFDIFGSSHQIFHIMIVIAAIIHGMASLREFHKRQLYPCPESFQLPAQ